MVANNPATGSPVITGTAQVGQSLYASLGSVADADGPSIIVASYQWIRVDGATETDITGATITPYTPVADDVGKQLKVRLSFTDDLGNPESRTSPPTLAVVAAAGANNAPVFTEGTSTTRSVAENTASSTNIGTAVAATDADSGDTLRYTLGGTDMASFAIVSTSGQLQTSAALDFETKSSYSVTVSVSDGNGGSDSIGVTITVTDVNEQPGRPAAPSVGATANSDTSLDVSWTAPGLNGGPAITGYHLQYRQGTSGSLDQRPAERQRHERDDHGPDGGHVVSGAGAGAERRNAQRLVPCGNRQHEFDGPTDTYPRGWSQSLQRGRRQRPDLCGTERGQHSTHHGSGGHRGRHGDGSGRLRLA